MNIGLDFDGVCTADPQTFKQIAKAFRDNGHSVFIVTMRYESECADIRRDWTSLVDAIVPTSRQAKQPTMEALGKTIHIWIDDNPRAINESAAQIWGSPSKEGDVIIVDHDAVTQ